MNDENTGPAIPVSEEKKDVICWDELALAIRTASRLFQPIADSYPDLMPYLVMCCRGGQVDLPETPLSALCHNSHMVADDIAKQEAMELLRKVTTANSKEKHRLEQLLENVAKGLHFVTDITFEIRFGSLRYESIWRMQQDPLIDRERTPQSKASIRIVFKQFKDLDLPRACPVCLNLNS